MQQMERDIASCAPLFAQSAGEQWVLRNLSTHEFVRCRPPAADKAAHVDHADAEWIRVDDVLLMHIYWTKLDDWRHEQIANQGLEAWERGAWAGHSFEIVALPWGQKIAVLGEEEEEDWRDITVEMVERAHRFRAALRRWGEEATKRRPRVVAAVTAAQLHARITAPFLTTYSPYAPPPLGGPSPVPSQLPSFGPG